MKVIKFGGSSLKNAKDFRDVAKIVKFEEDKKIVILSGVCGVTDTIQNYLNYEKFDDIAIRGLIQHLHRLHYRIASEAVTDIAIKKKVQAVLISKLEKLERLLQGVYFVEELTDRTRDLILSYGERLSVIVLEGVLQDLDIRTKAFEADDIGILTEGSFGNASAVLDIVSQNIKKNISPLLDKDILPVITGFFGCDSNGNTTSFGRNGSDYSASVIAYAVGADVVELWKDVDGFLSADPEIIKNASLIPNLSYEEAAELAYFGAKILHPRTIDPLRKKGIKLQIKNTKNPFIKGTIIGNGRSIKSNLIKSIAYNKDIACIKIHGSGVGYKPGVLSDIVSSISLKNINIKSVITSQTCINLLLDKKDLNKSYEILNNKQIKTVENIEKIKDIALISVVGDGILEHYGIAAQVFGAVANKKINIEMISAGASDGAYYFLVNEKYLESAIKEIHAEIFSKKIYTTY